MAILFEAPRDNVRVWLNGKEVTNRTTRLQGGDKPGEDHPGWVELVDRPLKVTWRRRGRHRKLTAVVVRRLRNGRVRWDLSQDPREALRQIQILTARLGPRSPFRPAESVEL